MQCIPNFLDELIRLDGRGDFADQSACGRCGHKFDNEIVSYRCCDCAYDKLSCKQCTVKFHVHNPLHRIERWDSGFFSRISLKELGLRIQLGHPSGEACGLPHPAKKDSFLIIDNYGIHEVGLDFCHCEKRKEHVIQLLRYGLYPATVHAPSTAATFRVLERFHILSFESKCSAQEFYRSLARETDNAGLSIVRDRYTEFLRVIRQWRHLKMLKRAGRGHVLNGSMNSEDGCCAVLCPACPQPEKNLEHGWENAPPDERWKTTEFLAGDANFQQRRKNVSSEDKDPSLSDGIAYFVRYTPYMAHLREHAGTKQERSTCVSHDAMNSADTKDTQGCVVTGLGAVDCARHDFRRPNSVGDLQRGERYINMDYMFWSGLRLYKLPKIVMSYDIACQWGRNFAARMASKFPADWSINCGQTFVKKLVPKFHLPAHIEKCQVNFSFNYTKCVGRTDGEAPERGWSKINGLAASAREMGPGSRRDTLEDHMGDSNWKKVVGMGLSLLRKIKEAIPMRAEHTHHLAQLEGVIDRSVLDVWVKELEAWENDNGKPNPFEPRVKPPTQNDIRLELASRDAQAGETSRVAIHCEITGSMMIHMGLELEELQRKLRFDIANLSLHATPLQKAKVQERITSLRNRITSWFDIQALYIPGTTLLRVEEQRTKSNNSSEVQIYNIQLWLPSAIGHQTTCDRSLQEAEWALREAQGNDALNMIRQHLRLDSFLTKRKKDWSRGVRANTRSLTTIEHNLSKMRGAIEKYRAAHAALSALESLVTKSNEWRNVLRDLADEDIRGLPVQGLGEGNRTLSWIWMAPGVLESGASADADPGLHDALRIQWCRARARKMRWSEEVELLQEEMSRVLRFLDWHAQWWIKQEKGREEGVDTRLQEGLSAYARRQASIRIRMKANFMNLWNSVDSWVKAGEVLNARDEDHLKEVIEDEEEVRL
ncbi:hypothetical protein JOM56_014648 [Amanita muscaria]